MLGGFRGLGHGGSIPGDDLGLGIGVWGLGFGAWGLGFGVLGFWGLGLGAWVSGFWGLGLLGHRGFRASSLGSAWDPCSVWGGQGGCVAE